MSGPGEGWLSDGLDDAADVGSGLWVRGVDYMAGWRVAREAADQLNFALLVAEFEPSELRAVAATNDDGHGVVRLVGLPGAAVRLAGLLERLADGDGGAR
ncbi:hypothetical protein F7R91_36035 [Streptomyces luteolifulvus]|uniref:Uncharacterized protein n=1 Tax=Streptomyces luteolifulvus TaxID=2615112 RepID=A0A6H9UQ81_9ACTN|nr:hypothetical protein [Streptomyces luteolifulvus]KAB1140508.1 hypothetical protein F7R91_36035 [Streptomyces luteolifulvus]